MLADLGVQVVEEGWNSGFVSQQLTNLMRVLGRLDVRLAWVVVFPLRVFTVIDRPLTRLICAQCRLLSAAGGRIP